jgi:uncharacterized membrane protein YczE
MEAPSDYKTAGIFMLIAGILTTLASLGFILGLIWLCVGVFWVLTLAVGVMEIVIGAAVMGGTPKPNAKTISILGIVAALLCGNIVGLVLEILAMLNFGKPEVENYLTLSA